MSLPNRVDPFGSLFATPDRGTLFGNRGGRFHCVESHTVRGRSYASKQWICCRLAFKNRRRTVWGKGYTELFFSDEYAALAAGHRPCFECRRDDANAFAAAWGRACNQPSPRAPVMDVQLHAERLEDRKKRLHTLPADTLPSGTMIVHQGSPWLVIGETRFRWTFTGYTTPERFDRKDIVNVLTPPAILSCLIQGYKPMSLQLPVN
ncbi:MAG: hypothetical protein ACRCWF_09805 [Beijerinckiaceae bacterium]